MFSYQHPHWGADNCSCSSRDLMPSSGLGKQLHLDECTIRDTKAFKQLKPNLKSEVLRIHFGCRSDTQTQPTDNSWLLGAEESIF